MSTVEVKTADLIGSSLNWAVAKVEHPHGVCYSRMGFVTISGDGRHLRYATDWAQGGPLIDRHHVQTSFNGAGFSRSPTGEHWCAYVCRDSGAEVYPSGSGPSALIAVCRAVVAANLGETVHVPAELL